MSTFFNISKEKPNFRVESRLHVKIYDAEEQVYQVPESVFPRPSSDDAEPSDSAFAFSWTEEPFSFKVVRKETNETLFDTSAASFIFENQYLRLRTSLPESPHLYGLGEHTDPFQLNTTNYTRTVRNSMYNDYSKHKDQRFCSYGIVMRMASLLAPTFMATIPSISITAEHLVPTASFCLARAAWTSKSTTLTGSTSSTML